MKNRHGLGTGTKPQTHGLANASPHMAFFLLHRKRLKITAATSPRGMVNKFRLRFAC